MIPAGPSLILLPSIASLGASDATMQIGEPNILGLSLTRRAVLAARRAGYGQIFFLAREHAPPTDTTVIPDWSRLADILPRSQAACLVIAPATILAETNWLKKLTAIQIEPGTWAAIPGRVVMLTAATIPDALAVLHADGGATDLTAVEQRLRHRFGLPAAVPPDIAPIIVAKPEDIRVAERRLLRGLVKDTDGFMARHVDRHISLQISRYLAPTSVRPTQITMVSMALGLIGAPFFLSSLWYWQLVGSLLFLLHSIVDGCDGELARLKFQESRYGGLLDFWSDNVVHVAIFGCIAVGWSLAAAATWPLWFGAAAIVGTLGSAGFVYWRQLRAKAGSGPLFTSVSTASDDSLAGMLDAASRRDFIYIVPIFAVFSKANWFLVLAAVGAPIFFLLLVFLAVREQLKRGSRRSAV